MSLVELLVATVVMTLVAGTLGVLAMSVQQTNRHSESRHLATQHARIALQRMERSLMEAYATEQFPGFAVFEELVAAESLPRVLVVWNPTGTPTEPDGLPHFNEIVIFTPADGEPNRLVSITLPGDTRRVPDLTDVAGWLAEIDSARRSEQAEIVELSNMIRTAKLADGGGNSSIGSAIRFEASYAPSLLEWADYKAGNISWQELTWPQNLGGSENGIRRCHGRIELQMAPPSPNAKSDNSAQNVMPFFGSAALHYKLSK